MSHTVRLFLRRRYLQFVDLARTNKMSQEIR